MRNFLVSLILCGIRATAQDTNPKIPTETSSSASPGTMTEQKLTVEEPGTLISEEKLYSGARIYVAPMLNGFENYIIAGLQQKKSLDFPRPRRLVPQKSLSWAAGILASLPVSRLQI
jgi:hypothetical protein